MAPKNPLRSLLGKSLRVVGILFANHNNNNDNNNDNNNNNNSSIDSEQIHARAWHAREHARAFNLKVPPSTLSVAKGIGRRDHFIRQLLEIKRGESASVLSVAAPFNGIANADVLGTLDVVDV